MNKIDIFDHRNPHKTPVWFMRQAGRYHSHYQNIKKNSNFMTMCKDSDLACEITMGPIRDFGFDAAILFSDLLFPLEQMNLGLNYDQGPPELKELITEPKDLEKAKDLVDPEKFYLFQKEALQKISKSLQIEKPNTTLLGFVGAPLTLFCYASEGKHAGILYNFKKALHSGLYEGFCEILMPNLLKNIEMQMEGGADAVVLFDTVAGELDPFDYKKFVTPKIFYITEEIKKKFPNKKILYFSKGTQLHHLKDYKESMLDGLSIDWRCNMLEFFEFFKDRFYIQGNLDPYALLLPWNQLKAKIEDLYLMTKNKNFVKEKWIFNLGHGVMPLIPEENVRQTVQFIQQQSL